jgi:threonyl-tRNA synthetase
VDRPTIQVDFNLPERFDVNFVGEDGERHRVAMIHRTLLGSMERFVGGLVEHTPAPSPPGWRRFRSPSSRSPMTRSIRPNVERRLRDRGLRVGLNDQRDRMQAKIRQAQLQKIPYMLVVGKREVEASAVAVRLRNGRDLGAMPVDHSSPWRCRGSKARSLFLDDIEEEAERTAAAD